ncbi:MAG: HsmA family protein [Bacteroidales bacterium]
MNTVDIHFLIGAIIVISSALVFYTIGVWGERIQGGLRRWHLAFFTLGLICDAVGTSLMEHIAKLTHQHNSLHTITGFIAISLMLIHAAWAYWTYFRGSAAAKRHFSRFSVLVWLIWLIPYFIGMAIGMKMHP